MNILITGANGFLGLHVVRRLNENHHVKALIHEKREEVEDAGCELVYGDVLDFSSLLKAAGENIDWIIHVAGAMSSSSADKNRLFRVNVEGVENIIKLAKSKKAKLIHLSSCVAVGTNFTAKAPLLSEESVNETIGKNFSNYDSKRIGEELVLKASRDKDIFAVVLNPGLIYGAGDARKTIRKGNIKAAKGNLPFYTSGGVNVIHVNDVVESIISAMENGRNGERYLITGDNITINELLSSLSKAAGARPPKHLLPNFLLRTLSSLHDALGLKGELSKENIFSATTFHWYDNSKARKELGLNPRSYREAIADSVDWMKKNHYLS